MTTKVKVSFPMADKTITVERDVEEDENVTAAVMRLLSEVTVLSKKSQGAQTLEHTRTEEAVKARPKSTKWVYQTQQPSAKFVERYAELMEEAEEETEEKVADRE